jgi:ribonuclease PH
LHAPAILRVKICAAGIRGQVEIEEASTMVSEEKRQHRKERKELRQQKISKARQRSILILELAERGITIGTIPRGVGGRTLKTAVQSGLICFHPYATVAYTITEAGQRTLQKLRGMP